MCFDEFHIIREIILGHGVVVFNKFVFVFFNVIHHVTSMWSLWCQTDPSSPRPEYHISSARQPFQYLTLKQNKILDQCLMTIQYIILTNT